eukprot:TRINITY_DN10983_c0_g1_i1.p1 TRINITY_DN10983_c0_g1~~TRINITY_DN10983_c0_g1_i1.p1  ORF type:complete len:115 (-),score=7.76 TRINITY_DN10983_c0_g1_i1:109-453(-)
MATASFPLRAICNGATTTLMKGAESTYRVTIHATDDTINFVSADGKELPDGIANATFRVTKREAGNITAQDGKLHLYISNEGIIGIQAYGEIRVDISQIPTKPVKEIVGHFNIA